MFTAHVGISVLLAVALATSATLSFAHYERILLAMAKAGVPESWLTMLGTFKAAGALGLLVGIGVPLIGTAAAVGVILYFVGAVITHLRVGDYSVAPAVGFGLVAVTALVLGLASP
jgi:hypothetical protein